MRLVAALIAPIAAILLVTGAPVSILLFGYGAATTAQAGLMGLIVSVFMLGLLPFTLFYVLLRGFYALEDTRTPFWVTVAFSVVLLAVAIPAFALARDGGGQVAALAGAYSVAYWVALVVTWALLTRRLGSLETGRTASVIARLLLAGAVSVGAMLAVARALPSWDGSTPLAHIALAGIVAVVAVTGALVFAASSWVLRITEVFDVLSLVGRASARFRRRAAR
jgi:putative peptidoglycan lipid II flippase